MKTLVINGGEAVDRQEIKDVLKVAELSTRITEIIDSAEHFTTSDLWGAIDAVILTAIRYGRGQ